MYVLSNESFLLDPSGKTGAAAGPGPGTIVHLYLPAVEAEIQASEPALTTPVPRQGRPRHLLYLDDEARLVELFRAQLEPRDCRVTGCTSPAEALDAGRADPAVSMWSSRTTTCRGCPVWRWHANSYPPRRSPGGAMSGYLSPAVQAAARAAGITATVANPTTMQHLARVIVRLLGTRPQTSMEQGVISFSGRDRALRARWRRERGNGVRATGA